MSLSEKQIMAAAIHEFADYAAQQQQWRDKMEASIRSKDGWLTVVGLEWLKEGENKVGSADDADIKLPAGSAPEMVGVLDFHDGKASFCVVTDERVTFNGEAQAPATLHDDHAQDGPTVIKVREVAFFIIQRDAQYGIRIKDANSPALKNFSGRHWFPVNADYRVKAQFTAHAENKRMPIENSMGALTTISNPGIIEFDLRGQHFALEAFQEAPGELWLIFRDETSGVTTYPATRYLKTPYDGGAEVMIDFNQAYHPPCAFTRFATCPFPPRQNRLPIAIEAGERL